jgi:hypothetical protein
VIGLYFDGFLVSESFGFRYVIRWAKNSGNVLGSLINLYYFKYYFSITSITSITINTVSNSRHLPLTVIGPSTHRGNG